MGIWAPCALPGRVVAGRFPGPNLQRGTRAYEGAAASAMASRAILRMSTHTTARYAPVKHVFRRYRARPHSPMCEAAAQSFMSFTSGLRRKPVLIARLAALSYATTKARWLG